MSTKEFRLEHSEPVVPLDGLATGMAQHEPRNQRNHL
jgi:hypothetical protein